MNRRADHRADHRAGHRTKRWADHCAHRWADHRDESGSASVLGVQVLVVLAVVTLVCCGIGAVIAAHRRAQAAADLGALAGATAIQQGAAGCAAVDRVVAANDAQLRACEVVGQTVRVTVLVRTPALLGHTRDLLAQARAGPATGGEAGEEAGAGPGP